MNVSGLGVAVQPLPRVYSASAPQGNYVKDSLSPAQIVTAAARQLGLKEAQLTDFVASGRSLSFSSVGGSGHAFTSGTQSLKDSRIPVTGAGLPDFDAIVAGGGSVKGVIPPQGAPMMTTVTQFGVTTAYAAVVNLGDGSPEQLVMGGDIRETTGSESDRANMVQYLAQTISTFPSNLDEAKDRIRVNNWPGYERTDSFSSPSRHIDTFA